MMNGIVQYLRDDGEFSFNVDARTQGRIARIDSNVARMYFVNRREGATESEAEREERAATLCREEVVRTLGLALYDSVTGQAVPACHGGEFLITWSTNYELMQGTNIILHLDVSRQHAVRTRLECCTLPP